MHLPRTKLLVQRLRTAYTTGGASLGKLAQELGGTLTAQGITEIFGERANPTSEQTLAILEFLKEPMSTRVFEPKPDRPLRVQNPDNPLTLTAARERIQELNFELQQMKATPKASVLPAPTLPAKLTSAAPTPAATDTKPAATMSAWEKELARASAARLEGLSSKPLTQQTVRELQAALNNAQLDGQATIYNELQKRRADARLLNPRAPLGGR